MKYIITAQLLGKETELIGNYSSDADMIEHLTREGYVIRKFRNRIDGYEKVVAGETLVYECLLKDLESEREKNEIRIQKMIKPLIVLAIWNGLITVGLILIAILSNFSNL